jgi:glycosyltransferase involved in cell wall biosynthesis
VDFLDEEKRGFIQNKPVTTTFIQKLPFAKTKFRQYLPLMPLAIEQLDLSTYDLIISSSHAVAKGVLTSPNQLHISYVHSPIRYAWDLQHQYLKESNLEKGFKSWMARWILHQIRLWDYRTANGVDLFIANSQFIARRIHKVYRRDAQVIYPPVDLQNYSLQPQKQNFYLTASRLVPYKRIDLIVEAFAVLGDRQLIVIGDGEQMAKIRSKAARNVKFLGHREPEELREYMQNAKAFVFAAEEDFGIHL